MPLFFLILPDYDQPYQKIWNIPKYSYTAFSMVQRFRYFINQQYQCNTSTLSLLKSKWVFVQKIAVVNKISHVYTSRSNNLENACNPKRGPIIRKCHFITSFQYIYFIYTFNSNGKIPDTMTCYMHTVLQRNTYHFLYVFHNTNFNTISSDRTIIKGPIIWDI